MYRWIGSALVAGVLAGCGDSSGPAAVVPQELVGEWMASAACAPPCAFTLAWQANPNIKANAFLIGLSDIRMEIGAGGRFVIGKAGQLPPAGTVRVRGEQLVVTDVDGTVDTVDYALQPGGSLRIQLRRTWSIVDFDQDQVLDPSVVSGVFVRR
jgi:hypothetical protein